MLEACRDELGDANNLVEQLRLENTRKWRVEERDDWRALLDSMQSDRTALQHRNDKLEVDLARCIAMLLSIFPFSSRKGAGAAATKGALTGRKAQGGGGGGGGVGIVAKGEGSSAGADDSDDHPPELTQRSRRSVCNRAIAAVDLEWLNSLAREYDVAASEDVGGDGDGGAVGSRAASPNGGGGDPASECLRLRVELDVLRHESNKARVTLESQVFEQEQELRKLRSEVSRSTGLRGGAGAAGGVITERGGVSLAGVFRWWRQDRALPTAEGRKRTGGGKGPVSGAITVV
ncbi:unnamed protein product [Pylaiella littoralis]